MDEYTNKWIYEWKNKQMSDPVNKWVVRWINTQMNECISKWLNIQMTKKLKERMNKKNKNKAMNFKKTTTKRKDSKNEQTPEYLNEWTDIWQH